MPIPIPKPRHTVEKSDDFVRVTLPSKKNIFRILFMCLWFFLWGYMVYGFLYIAITINTVIEIGKNSTPAVQPGNVLIFVSIFFSLLFLMLLAFGAFGIYRFLWSLAGKEVIEANSNILRVSRKLFSWERGKEYLAHEIKDLRVTAIQSGFIPIRGIRKLLASNDMIAFDYGSKTFRFGSELEEAEAKQIILAIKDGISQQNAG